MKIKHIKSKVVSPEENRWYDIDFNTEIATCSRCKRRGKLEPQLLNGVVTQLVILIVPLVVLL